jgi:hypothetical protein
MASGTANNNATCVSVWVGVPTATATLTLRDKWTNRWCFSSKSGSQAVGILQSRVNVLDLHAFLDKGDGGAAVNLQHEGFHLFAGVKTTRDDRIVTRLKVGLQGDCITPHHWSASKAGEPHVNGRTESSFRKGGRHRFHVLRVEHLHTLRVPSHDHKTHSTVVRGVPTPPPIVLAGQADDKRGLRGQSEGVLRICGEGGVFGAATVAVGG